MTDLVMATANSFMQAPHVAHQVVAKCTPVIHTVTQNVPYTPWSFYMYAVLAAVITGAITSVIGYFVGKRGLTGTQSDLSNAVAQVQKVPSEVSTVAAEVKAAV